VSQFACLSFDTLCVAVCCSRFEVCCSVLQCVAVCCSVLQCVARVSRVWVSFVCNVMCLAPLDEVTLFVAVCCGVLQCVAVCCSKCVLLLLMRLLFVLQ